MFDTTVAEQAIAFADVRRGTYEGELVAEILASLAMTLAVFAIPYSRAMGTEMDLPDDMWRYFREFYPNFFDGSLA